MIVRKQSFPALLALVKPELATLKQFTYLKRFRSAAMTGDTKDPNHHDTIIIGAGISGLACASRLLEHASYQNEKKLLVLEARNRIGGRIEAVRVHGNRLDTGANWIHGIGTKDDPNPLVQILPNKRFKELRCSVSFRPSVSKTDRPKIVTESEAEFDWVNVDSIKTAPSQLSKDDLVIPSHIAGDLFGALWDLIGSLHEKALKMSTESAYQTSMLEAITKDESFKSAFKEIAADYHQTLRALPQFVENMEAGPLDSTSAEHGAEHRMGLLEFALDDFEGDQVFLQDGYTPLVEEVGKHVIKEGHLKLGVEVKSISWDTEPMVITTSEGNYTASRIICTIPLGVLQNRMRPERQFSSEAALFVPQLPAEKVEAIASLGFGTLDKIFLVYSQAWWTDEPYASILKKGLVDRPILEGEEVLIENTKSPEPDNLWGFTDELAGLDVGPDGTVNPGARALSVINLHALTGFPVLSSFVSCANAVRVESLSDHAASMVVHRALKRWFGCEPPLPEAVHVTRWAQDEYSLGSYTHMITGLSKTSHREAFQTPLVNKHGAELRFAGEHTSTNHFATAHGALLSGWREAGAIIESEASAAM